MGQKGMIMTENGTEQNAPAAQQGTRASAGSDLILYLEYFHEDLCFMFHILFVILCFGFGFTITGYIFLAATIGQMIMAARKLYLYKANNRISESCE